MTLQRWTAGLAGPRDAAQPLLTLVTPEGRVELSGATTANWVAKDANLLVDGLGAPGRVGLLLPLHWQAVALLLAGVATGADVVVAASADELAGCGAAFTTAESADDALAAGVDEVVVVSTSPLGLPGEPAPPPFTDHAREVPGYGDHWGGPAPASVRVVAGGEPVTPASGTATGPADRVLVHADPADAGALALVLGALASGAALVLAATPDDLAQVAAAESATATVGADVPGLRRLG
ncbi:MAG TPA: TIGR03089 family protein [Mycobacteriales bacterium]|nr:TIGR03089 family protein [Mycobacteriales bacterium]